jgi:hypothetical protein
MFDRARFLMDVQARGEVEIVAVMALQPLGEFRAAGGLPVQ